MQVTFLWKKICNISKSNISVGNMKYNYGRWHHGCSSHLQKGHSVVLNIYIMFFCMFLWFQSSEALMGLAIGHTDAINTQGQEPIMFRVGGEVLVGE